MTNEPEEKEFIVVAVATITSTFTVYAESEEDAKDLVTDGDPTEGFDYRIEDADETKSDGWDVVDVKEK